MHFTSLMNTYSYFNPYHNFLEEGRGREEGRIPEKFLSIEVSKVWLYRGF